jgi:WD40 repeat protein
VLNPSYVASISNELCIWDIETNTQKFVLDSLSEEIGFLDSVAMSSKQIAVCSNSHCIAWDWRDDKITNTLSLSNKSLLADLRKTEPYLISYRGCLSLIHDTDLIVTSLGGKLQIWDLPSRENKYTKYLKHYPNMIYHNDKIFALEDSQGAIDVVSVAEECLT